MLRARIVLLSADGVSNTEIADQLDGRPPRWKAATALLGLAQALDLGEDPGAKVVKVPEENLGSRRDREGRTREGFAHRPIITRREEATSSNRGNTVSWNCPAMPSLGAGPT